MSYHSSKIFINVMEELVIEEVDRRLKILSPKLAKYIDRLQVSTYALNRLPPLYASSQEGARYQKQRGRYKLYEQVRTAVAQGLNAVQCDPLRVSTPLTEDAQFPDPAADRALLELRAILERRDLTWQSVVPLVARAVQSNPSDGASSHSDRRTHKTHL
ncbi:late competence development ComFB family protein [Oscillatoriales cyanobacterium LEGE 11467]|uniref:Late competence development ComFB family protein n=1 Tax=Zarconia navalis LEGE 11467 TaxID=1828826 RepID=A0A928Z8R2_9CYAN|nr:late competence development ComFB family protein [Zarconia navalis]MBE9041830.1 late competence development ComFB family protein [Zarconia navalis LEGE 11467]